jgi:hypothetical protein
MRKYFFFPCIVLLCSCAASYNTINPKRLDYSTSDSLGGLSFAYKYDVLREAGNRKYAKKESTNHVKVLAIKITNNTNKVINVSNDIVFYSGKKPIVPMSPTAVKDALGQNTPLYALYLLFTPTKIISSTDGVTTSSFPIGYILGPALAITNIAVAGSANKNFLQEMEDYNLLTQDIEIGETAYGLIGINDDGFNPISIKIKQ